MSPSRAVLLTGATGYIGAHLTRALVAAGHAVTALVRDVDHARAVLPAGVATRAFDLRDTARLDAGLLRDADVLVHLAWPGLPRYHEPFHETENLPQSLAFLEAAAQEGAQRVLVAGTCAEFGPREGPCAPSDPTAPRTPYARSKDRLHAALRASLGRDGVALQWVRLFYMHGPGQGPNSLLSQLDAAIARGDAEFPMSRGEHARDYLPVEEVARGLVRVVERGELRGPLHVCSGRPTRIRELVQAHIAARGASIRPRLGALPDPVGEPASFWGVPSV